MIFERICTGCDGKGGRIRWTAGCRMPDPQTEELCNRCEGRGVEDVEITDPEMIELLLGAITEVARQQESDERDAALSKMGVI